MSPKVKPAACVKKNTLIEGYYCKNCIDEMYKDNTIKVSWNMISSFRIKTTAICNLWDTHINDHYHLTKSLYVSDFIHE